MQYDERPWLKSYDPGIPADVEIPDVSVVDYFDRLESERGDKAALHFHGITLTFRELFRYGNSFAHYLTENGCRPGDIVAINLPNVPQYLIAQVGITKAGCAASGISPLLTPSELAYQLNDSKARALVTFDAIFEHRLLEVHEQLPHLKLIVVTGLLDFLPWAKRVLGRWLKKVPHGAVRALPNKQVAKFMRILERYPNHRPNVPVDPQFDFLIQYTGGTTGVPKGAVLTHANVVANLTQIRTWLDPDPDEEIILSGFPLFHLAGLALALNVMAMGGTQILIPNPRDTKHIVKEMARHRPTILANVPSLYMMLMEEPGFRRLDFSRLKYCLCSASPFPVESMKDLEAIIGPNKVLEAYGMTETSPIITINPRKGAKKMGTVGLPVSGTRVRLLDLETGTRDVPVGAEGEIAVRGPQVMRGYLNKPEETAVVLRDYGGETWLRTGDVARMDGDGFFTIVDRTKDMLNVGGYKVFSREVEEKLYEHPAIEFCAIIGVPNPKRPGTDLVKLVAQLTEEHRKRDSEETKAEIIEFARRNLAPYKTPKIVEFVDAIPLTTIGKVNKKALR
jgi:acyl-CoA synthetase (AMP-forming)/AMP-acid ligase II